MICYCTCNLEVWVQMSLAAQSGGRGIQGAAEPGATLEVGEVVSGPRDQQPAE